MFVRQRTDKDALKALETELEFRHVPRAISLLRRVKAALKAGGSSGLPEQPKLFEPVSSLLRSRPEPAFILPKPEPTSSVVSPKPEVRPSNLENPATSTPIPIPEVSQLALDEACKVLHVTPGTPWAEIELSRSRIVQRAHPDAVERLSPEKRAAARAEAQRANAAYAALLEARRG
jgi:hypothetical protein